MFSYYCSIIIALGALVAIVVYMASVIDTCKAGSTIANLCSVKKISEGGVEI
jgi:hypothetical protein